MIHVCLYYTRLMIAVKDMPETRHNHTEEPAIVVPKSQKLLFT